MSDALNVFNYDHQSYYDFIDNEQLSSLQNYTQTFDDLTNFISNDYDACLKFSSRNFYHNDYKQCSNKRKKIKPCHVDGYIDQLSDKGYESFESDNNNENVSRKNDYNMFNYHDRQDIFMYSALKTKRDYSRKQGFRDDSVDQIRGEWFEGHQGRGCYDNEQASAYCRHKFYDEYRDGEDFYRRSQSREQSFREYPDMEEVVRESHSRGEFFMEPHDRRECLTELHDRREFLTEPHDRGEFSRKSRDRGKFSRESRDRGKFSRKSRDRGKFPRESLDRGEFPRGSRDRGEFPRGSRDGGEFSRGSRDGGEFPRESLDRGEFPRESLDRGEFSRGSRDRGKFPRGSRDRGEFSRGSRDRGEFSRGSRDGGEFSREFRDRGEFSRGSRDRGEFSRGSRDRGEFSRESRDRGEFSKESRDRGEFSREFLDRGEFSSEFLDRGEFSREFLDRGEFSRESLDRGEFSRGSRDRGEFSRESCDREEFSRDSRYTEEFFRENHDRGEVFREHCGREEFFREPRVRNGIDKQFVRDKSFKNYRNCNKRNYNKQKLEVYDYQTRNHSKVKFSRGVGETEEEDVKDLYYRQTSGTKNDYYDTQHKGSHKDKRNRSYNRYDSEFHTENSYSKERHSSDIEHSHKRPRAPSPTDDRSLEKQYTKESCVEDTDSQLRDKTDRCHKSNSPLKLKGTEQAIKGNSNKNIHNNEGYETHLKTMGYCNRNSIESNQATQNLHNFDHIDMYLQERKKFKQEHTDVSTKQILKKKYHSPKKCASSLSQRNDEQMTSGDAIMKIEKSKEETKDTIFHTSDASYTHQKNNHNEHTIYDPQKLQNQKKKFFRNVVEKLNIASSHDLCDVMNSLDNISRNLQVYYGNMENISSQQFTKGIMGTLHEAYMELTSKPKE